MPLMHFVEREKYGTIDCLTSTTSTVSNFVLVVRILEGYFLLLNRIYSVTTSVSAKLCLNERSGF